MKTCHCKEKPFTYQNATTGQRIYICNKTNIIFDEKKKKEVENLNNPPCDYKEIIQEHNPTFNIFNEQKKQKKQRTQLKKKNTNKNEEIKRLVNSFLHNKYWSTFQEIEILCNELNIEIYNEKKESIYEFTQRITQS